LNLGDHVGDDPAKVKRNRRGLVDALEMPGKPRWLAQMHGSAIALADDIKAPVEADAAFSNSPNVVCAVLTADCLPILLCDARGKQVAAVHAGWRGLCAGVVELAVHSFLSADIPAGKILAWLGPAISQSAYEVDAVVKDAFTARNPDCAGAFIESRPGHWQLDLYFAAREILGHFGVNEIYGGDFCTWNDTRFFSHRRDGNCGRQATLIWLT
ncbi:MAG: peptidoglycan editing factor PgeF, partial [Gammaproteobacteria bacterium]